MSFFGIFNYSDLLNWFLTLAYASKPSTLFLSPEGGFNITIVKFTPNAILLTYNPRRVSIYWGYFEAS